MANSIPFGLLNLVSPFLLLTPLAPHAPLTPPRPSLHAQSGNPAADRLTQQVLTLYQQGRYREAIPLAQEVLTLQEKTLGANHPYVATSMNNLAELYRAQGQYGKAEALFQRSLAIYEKKWGANSPIVATSLNNLAELYRNQGRYGDAEPLYQRSLGIDEKFYGSDHQQVATDLNNLALLYRAQGRYGNAESLFRRSIALYEKNLGPEDLLVANSLNNLAELYNAQKQDDQAEPLYLRSLAIREKKLGADHPSVATSLNNLAVNYDNQGQYAKAKPLYLRSLAIFQKNLGPEHPNVANTLNNLAALYDIQSQYAQAEPLYQRSLNIRKKVLGPNHPDVATSLNNLAVLYQSQKDFKRTVEFTEKALSIEEFNLAQNLLLGTEQDKRDYLATVLGSMDSIISFHLQDAPNQLDAANLAFTTILRRKGRVLDVLSQNLQALRRRWDPATQKEFEKLIQLRSQLATLVAQQNLSSEQRQSQYQVLTKQIQFLEATLSLKSSGFQQATQPVTLGAVQALIPKNAALVEFIQYRPFNPKAKSSEKFGSPHYAVYLLSSQGQPQWSDLGTVAELDPLIKTFRNTIQDRRLQLNQVKATARRLDAKLMQPVRALLKKSQPQHLLIAPDSQLNLIPFAALVDEQNRYLLETYEITYLTSGRDLIRRRDASVKVQAPLILANPNFMLAEAPKTKNLIARTPSRSERSGDLATLVFDSLPGTALEADVIAPLVPQSRLFTGIQATEAILKQSANPRILHLATHGFFLMNRPSGKKAESGQSQPLNIENPLLRSGLALAGVNARQAGGEDGVLTALEVTGLDLRGTELVVLSACDTGLGEVANGEGVYGLRRAITLAGAHSQLMSLWKVNDLGAKDLMIHYYQYLSQRRGRGDALRQVQLDMLNRKITGKSNVVGNVSPDYQHPYYWSAFIPLGDWSPLPKN